MTIKQLTVAFWLFGVGTGMGTIVFIIEKTTQKIKAAAKVPLSIVKRWVHETCK